MIGAATTIVVRDGEFGLEVLLLQRSPRSRVFPGAWVFPGGGVEPRDGSPGSEDAVRRAAVREAQEEAGIWLDPQDLHAWARWRPPAGAPIRVETAYFVATATARTMSIDQAEVVDSWWCRPADALARHGAGDLPLMPPTWWTLNELRAFPSVASLLAGVPDEPASYATQIKHVAGRTLMITGPGRPDVDITALPWRLVPPANLSKELVS